VNTWRTIYEHDIRPLLVFVHKASSEVRSVYVGPPGRAINGYERLGRIVAGTLLVLFWLWLGLIVAGFGVALIVQAVSWIRATQD
jgi:hypothetical protein